MSALPETRAANSAARTRDFLAAGRRIAPAWPLDQLIAVNPWWEWRDQPFTSVAATLATLGNVQCLPGAGTNTPRWLNVSDWIDLPEANRTRQRRVSWHEEIVHQLSQFCGDFLQRTPAAGVNADTLYRGWRDVARRDRGLPLLMGEPGLPSVLAALPEDRHALVELALSTLSVRDERVQDYGVALLLDINGWASTLAWLRWQARLAGRDNDAIEGLLAARLAWDYALWQLHHPHAAGELPARWQAQWHALPAMVADASVKQQPAVAALCASERRWQQSLQARLAAPRPAVVERAQVLQAAFCIDVRSEPMRRALEAQDPGIRTLGFAGFFGLPVEYQPAGSGYARPQLPGLLAPRLRVVDAGDAPDGRRPSAACTLAWNRFSGEATTAFTAVEGGGLLHLFNLLRRAFTTGAPAHPVNGLPAGGRLRVERDGVPLTATELAALANGVLGAMGLHGELAPRVLLVGHGSTTCNNPHAAGLDCGACGGQTGEVNVRLLAQILNDDEVRAAMAAPGRTIAPGTRFVAALHDTTTDAIRCFAQAPGDVDATLQGWLAAAGEAARSRRAPSLGIAAHEDPLRAVTARSRDWAQVRPEWGLAGNAGFIVAPRAFTRHLDLQGRCFLHDYDWRTDREFALLELIMTAPMVVTHWINMQYNASVTDNTKYGSGNKLLHNVVGGHLGVFEGNGGDLRIGLPLQSVHDGTRWMHEPLRLGVFIAAPAAAIDAVIARHETVRQLVENAWLHLFRLDDNGVATQRTAAGWEPAGPPG